MLVVLLIFRAVLVDLTIMEGTVVVVAVHLCHFSLLSFLPFLACFLDILRGALIYIAVWAFIAIVLDVLVLSLALILTLALVLTLTVVGLLGKEGLGNRG
jgi:hypothetical protein